MRRCEAVRQLAMVGDRIILDSVPNDAPVNRFSIRCELSGDHDGAHQSHVLVARGNPEQPGHHPIAWRDAPAPTERSECDYCGHESDEPGWITSAGVHNLCRFCIRSATVRHWLTLTDPHRTAMQTQMMFNVVRDHHRVANMLRDDIAATVRQTVERYIVDRTPNAG